MNKTLLLFFSLLLTSYSFSQQYNFSTYSIEHGLSHSQVLVMYEDSRGYIWIGTDGGGVCLFDGVNFRTYNMDDGLSDNQIRSIFEDSNGNMWFGTKNAYLSKFDGNKFTIYNHKSGLNSPTIQSITEDNEKNIWVGTKDGLYKLEGNSFQKTNLLDTDKVSITTLLFDKDILWVGTEKQGVVLINANTKINITTRDGLCSNNINSISEGNNESIWIATTDGANKLILNKKTFIIKSFSDKTGLINKDITSICEDNTGNIWFGTLYGGGKYNGKTHIEFNTDNGFPNDFVSDILYDRSGNIWFGTFGGGICKFDSEKFKHFSIEDGLAHNYVMSICEDDKQNMWFGAYDKGVCMYDGSKFNYFNKNNGLCSEIIYCIHQDKKGNMWFGSKRDGLSKYDGRKFRNYNTKNGLTSNRVYSILEDRHGNIWFGTLENGVSIYNGTSFTNITKEDGLSSNLIFDMYEDLEGNIWLSTDDKGVDMILARQSSNDIIKNKKVNTDDLLNINTTYGLCSNQVSTITQSKNGDMWFGTYGGGVCRFDNKNVIKYSTKEGLNSNYIYQLYCDSNDFVWVGTEKGVNKIEYNDTSKQISVKVYGRSEGFSSIETNLHAITQDHEGLMWFGTIKGVTIYDNKHDHQNDQEPLIQITNVQLFSEDVDWSTYSDSLSSWDFSPKNLILPYDQNHLTFQFSGIDMKAPDKVKYEWILEGFDKRWSPISSKQEAVYSYIPHGDYIFKVRSYNSDGIVNQQAASFIFSIPPPFWTTWWFFSIIGVLTSALIFIFVKLRLRSLERDKKILAEKVKSRTEELEEEKVVVEQQAEELRTQTENLGIINSKLEKLSIVASKTDNSIVTLNKEGYIEWVNEGFTKLYGYTFDEYKAEVGSHIYDMGSNVKIKDHIKQSVKDRKTVVYVSLSKTREGKRIWIQTTLTPIFDVNGDLKQLVAIDADITKIKLAEEEIKQEKEKSDQLLLNILPNETAEELKEKGISKPRGYKSATVLFTDFKGFTSLCEGLSPEDIVNRLHEYFIKFDEIIEYHALEKIKTIGDAYMCAGGLPIRNKSHAIDSVLAGLEIQHYINTEAEKNKDAWSIRLGIHTGEVVAGVVGKKKFAYDIWGDAVNIASRMESSSEVGKVNISETTYKLIEKYFDCTYRGKIEAKNKGKIDMYYVNGLKKAYSDDVNKIFPNPKFYEILSEL